MGCQKKLKVPIYCRNLSVKRNSVKKSLSFLACVEAIIIVLNKAFGPTFNDGFITYMKYNAISQEILGDNHALLSRSAGSRGGNDALKINRVNLAHLVFSI